MIWILYSNPYDEGDNIYGYFSTEEKANKAHEVFSEVSKHELYIREVELDILDKYFERALSGYRVFSGYRSRYEMVTRTFFGDWNFDEIDFDWMLEDEERKDSVMERPTHIWASIKAKSKEEAIEIADKILNEKKDGYIEWLK